MVSKNNIFTLIALILSVISFSCTKPTNGLDFDKDTYVPLSLGDIRQSISLRDSSTMMDEVFTSTFRADSIRVFGRKYFVGDEQSDAPQIFYNYIKDGYFISTQLDTVKDLSLDISKNPFNEQRLAELYPKDGDTWVHSGGEHQPTIMKAKYIGSKTTPCKTFDDVFQFSIPGVLDIYYAKGIGWIGARFMGEQEVLVTYIKVGSREFGKLLPPKPPQPGINKKLRLRDASMMNVLGMIR